MQMFIRAVADETMTYAAEYGAIAAIVAVSFTVVVLQLVNAL